MTQDQEIDIQARPGGQNIPSLSATLIGTIEALSSRAGRYRLVLVGNADHVDELANVARMQVGFVRIHFTEENGE